MARLTPLPPAWTRILLEAILFIGLQAAGKSTFYRQRFASTHLRINLDLLKTRGRERQLLLACLHDQKNLVVDNTNATRAERERYIQPARAAGYSVIGYFFEVDLPGCLRRNAARPPAERVPVPGLFATRKKLQPPDWNEGFDQLFSVEARADETFSVRAWIRS